MIIVVAGLPGSGKSFLAQRLAERLSAIRINSDQVRLEMNQRGQYSLSDKFIVYREMASRAVEGIKANKDVVVDATFFHHSMRELFLDISKERKVPMKVIEVIADEALIRRRLAIPRKDSEATFTVYENIRDAFEEIVIPHLIVTSTDNNIQELLDRSLQYIHHGRV